MISTPLCLYDCDAPCDGSTAVVVSHRDYAPDTPRPACHVNAIGTALRGRPSWDQFDDMTTMAARDAAASMWERTELRPADVDVAELYDGFSILTMVWLEELGFCAKGESGPFVEGGERIALDGAVPLNTSGGQLSAGRLHGFGLLHEACVQLRGEGGERQVPGTPEVAVVADGGGPIAGSMLLTRGPRERLRGRFPLADTNVRQLRSRRAPALRRARPRRFARAAGLDGGEPAAVRGARRAGPVLGPHPRVGPALAAAALRQRLARAGLASRVRRAQRHPGAADGVLRGAGRAWACPAAATPRACRSSRRRSSTGAPRSRSSATRCPPCGPRSAGAWA